MTNDERYLGDRHCVVTGGGGGIGQSIALELARLGASVTVMGRDVGALENSVQALHERAGGEHRHVQCDVTSEDSVAAAFGWARDLAGDPWVLVNNAGAAMAAKVEDTPRIVWDEMLAVNLTSAFLCAKEVLPAMVKGESGRIVNIGSIASLTGAARLAAYTAAKHGLLGLTRALAAETAKHGVTVNAVCPGYTNTRMAAAAVNNLVAGRGVSREEARKMITGTIPRGRMIEPSEVASTVAWLCSPGAATISGQAIVLNGGEA